MPTLFFDTETTGLVDWKLAPDSPKQPELVQLGAVLRDDAGAEVASIDLIVEAHGFVIPERAAAVHGITTEKANAVGISLDAAIAIFDDLLYVADRVVAHNLQYDEIIMRSSYARVGRDPEGWQKVAKVCTKDATTNVLRLPKPNGMRGFKWPTLDEAHRYFTNEGVENAHSAIVDVRACMTVFDGLVAMKIIQPLPERV